MPRPGGTVLPLCSALLVLALAAPVHAATVAVILSAGVDDYRTALRGFKSVAKHHVVAEYDMEGDLDRGRKILNDIQTKVKPDLIFAVGVWALQVVAGQSTESPVVYAMVLNPPSIVGAGTKNITGASMNVAVEQSLRLLKQLGPNVKRIGLVFNRSKTGYLVKRAEEVARDEGLQLVTKEIKLPKDAIPAIDALQEEAIDALWILPDETLLAPPVVQHMLLVSYRKKLPLLGLSERHAQMGALLSLSFGSSEDVGRQAGELANAVLGGKAPAEMPYTTARQVSLIVNLKAAQKLGMEIPKPILARATNVIQ